MHIRQDAGAGRAGSQMFPGRIPSPPPTVPALALPAPWGLSPGIKLAAMYFTDRGIEELEKRRGEEEVTFEWLAEQLRTFVDLNPDFEVPVERLATWLARLDDEDEE